MLKAIVLVIIIGGLGIAAVNQGQVSAIGSKSADAIAQLERTEQGTE